MAENTASPPSCPTDDGQAWLLYSKMADLFQCSLWCRNKPQELDCLKTCMESAEHEVDSSDDRYLTDHSEDEYGHTSAATSPSHHRMVGGHGVHGIDPFASAGTSHSGDTTVLEDPSDSDEDTDKTGYESEDEEPDEPRNRSGSDADDEDDGKDEDSNAEDRDNNARTDDRGPPPEHYYTYESYSDDDDESEEDDESPRHSYPTPRSPFVTVGGKMDYQTYVRELNEFSRRNLHRRAVTPPPPLPSSSPKSSSSDDSSGGSAEARQRRPEQAPGFRETFDTSSEDERGADVIDRAKRLIRGQSRQNQNNSGEGSPTARPEDPASSPTRVGSDDQDENNIEKLSDFRSSPPECHPYPLPTYRKRVASSDLDEPRKRIPGEMERESSSEFEDSLTSLELDRMSLPLPSDRKRASSSDLDETCKRILGEIERESSTDFEESSSPMVRRVLALPAGHKGAMSSDTIDEYLKKILKIMGEVERESSSCVKDASSPFDRKSLPLPTGQKRAVSSEIDEGRPRKRTAKEAEGDGQAESVFEAEDSDENEFERENSYSWDSDALPDFDQLPITERKVRRTTVFTRKQVASAKQRLCGGNNKPGDLGDNSLELTSRDLKPKTKVPESASESPEKEDPKTP